MLLLYLLLPHAYAQTYRYIGLEDGLSSRRVYAIQKDKKGYMWFLTHNGIDRYSGSEIKQYHLVDGEKELNAMMHLSRIAIDSLGNLWEIGYRGTLHCYDHLSDRFVLKYRMPEADLPVTAPAMSYGFIDGQKIWLCTQDSLRIYRTDSERVTAVPNPLKQSIEVVVPLPEGDYCAATEKTLYQIRWSGDRLEVLPLPGMEDMQLQINELFYHQASRKLFVGTLQQGLFVYDLQKKVLNRLDKKLVDICINCIRQLDNHTLLIATDGAGVYRMNTDTYECHSYIKADFMSPNGMNGNNIMDLYIDDCQRIWMANYPIGVTLCDRRFDACTWYKHAAGNSQTIVHDQINHVMEDSDGDLWFATNNGVSLYQRRSGRWTSYLSDSDRQPHVTNHTFLSLCEVERGIVWLGGYSSGLHEIHKQTGEVIYFTPSNYSRSDIRSDKYIRAMKRSADGTIWCGGYYNLKAVNRQTKSIRLFPELNGITAIVERDAHSLWIGTSTGLFLLEKASGKVIRQQLPIPTCYIYALCYTPGGKLLIGTSNRGLLVFDEATQHTQQYIRENCALISNNIYSILYDRPDQVVLSTENAITFFNPLRQSFKNWTREQGLNTDHFNASAGILTHDGQFVFGSTDGAIAFGRDHRIPDGYISKMVFSDLRIFYQTVYPGDKDSPLSQDIDQTETLRLRYNQNIFSLRVSSINYDYPSLALYTWKLEGFYDQWIRPDRECRIRFTNLDPGSYLLRVRAISNEDRRVVLEERTMRIIIAPPVWLSPKAIALYVVLGLGLLILGLRYAYLRRQRTVSNEKIRFFINTAHDLRTPLTLIQSPLEEVKEQESLSDEGKTRIAMALRNVKVLLYLTTNLLNFERADHYGEQLRIAEYALKAYLNDLYEGFRAYAEMRGVTLSLFCSFDELTVWMDKHKMDSILKNLLSNAIKYTPKGGAVRVTAKVEKSDWKVEVADTGIGIPESEQKKLFRIHYRASNAVNSQVAGSGIGLLLVKKLVKRHKGKIVLTSLEGKGTTVMLSFPMHREAYPKAVVEEPLRTEQEKAVTSLFHLPKQEQVISTEGNSRRPVVMVVEDNDELRRYLQESLSADYEVRPFSNGQEALEAIQKRMPQLLISDIMMPGMQGDELCRKIKENMATSHIPVVLLTALIEERHVIGGLRSGADEYVTKPFHIGVLKATIAGLLANRERMKRRFLSLTAEGTTTASVEPGSNPVAQVNDLDQQFILAVRKAIEEHMADPKFNIDKLCSLLHMSRTSFYTKLKALTDEAPADYSRLVRLQHAACMLKEGKYSLTEIAEQTGFNDAKYFREVFKKHYHVSPTHYAREGRSSSKEALPGKEELT